jgi:DHA3 family tetracycline resistance protein-like MFS transporter
LWNVPAALSIVGIAMSLPTIACLLVGGAVSDRFDRRLVMLLAEAGRGVTIAILAALALTHTLTFGALVAVVAAYSLGAGFFTPAFEAVVPSLVSTDDLPQANALDQFVRPIAMRLVGPALGGVILGAAGAGTAFAFDAASFAASAVAIAALRPIPRDDAATGSTLAAVRDGFAFVRARTWLWGTLASAAIAYLVFLGPTEVLLPYLVKNGVHGSATDLGLVLASGGIGAIGAAAFMAERGHPRRSMTFIYVCWTLATLAVLGYAAGTTLAQLMLACLLFNGFEAAGTVVWSTVKQRHVPPALLGRVSSLDWLISISLLPISFALTGPAAAAVGVRATLAVAGVVGAAATLGALFLPGMRDVEERSDGWRGDTADTLRA